MTNAAATTRYRLRNGDIDDATFDALYPTAIRFVSRRYWTPVAVAKRAADLFVEHRIRRVLDVGSGVGKFVLVAAHNAPAIEIVGVEQRLRLVEIARRAQKELRIENARFVVGDATESSWDAFDGIYFFNPFAENLFDGKDRLDDRVELSMKRFALHVTRVERALRKAAVGSVLVTYFGSSGRIPSCYDVVHAEKIGSDHLRAWKKTREDDGEGAFFIEGEGGVARHYHRDLS
jgi:SAM-dependent methyltransferase